MSEPIASVREQIRKGKLRSALDRLDDHLAELGQAHPTVEVYRELQTQEIHLASRWGQSNRKHTLGLINDADHKVEHNNVAYGILQICQQLEGPLPEIFEPKPVLESAEALGSLLVIYADSSQGVLDQLRQALAPPFQVETWNLEEHLQLGDQEESLLEALGVADYVVILVPEKWRVAVEPDADYQYVTYFGLILGLVGALHPTDRIAYLRFQFFQTAILPDFFGRLKRGTYRYQDHGSSPKVKIAAKFLGLLRKNLQKGPIRQAKLMSAQNRRWSEAQVHYFLRITNLEGDTELIKRVTLKVHQGLMNYRNHEVVSDSSIAAWEDLAIQAHQIDPAGKRVTKLEVEKDLDAGGKKRFRVMFPQAIPEGQTYRYEYQVNWPRFMPWDASWFVMKNSAPELKLDLALPAHWALLYTQALERSPEEIQAPALLRQITPSISKLGNQAFISYSYELIKPTLHHETEVRWKWREKEDLED
ncbi:MAG: hypothetical protein AAF804_03515 [Bacteroidota bacterium]